MTASRTLRLVEGGVAESADLTSDEVRWLLAERVAEITPAPGRGRWRIQTKHVAGIVSRGELTVSITPKLPVRRVLWLLEQAHGNAGWHTADAPLADDVTLTEAVAALYLRLVETLVARSGLRRGYIDVAETSWTLRGRLRTSHQLTRHHGRLLPLEIEYDDYSLDTAENRVLATALMRVRDFLVRLSTPYGILLRRRAEHLMDQFEGVSLLPAGGTAPTTEEHRLSRGYAGPLSLAQIILDGGSLNPRVGVHQAHGLVLSMPRLFEDFVAGVLRRQMGSCLRTQRKVEYGFDGTGHVTTIRPDLVVVNPLGLPVTALDTKYKSDRDRVQDMYQMHVYARLLGIQDVTIVLGESAASRTLVLDPSEAVRLHVRGIDLTAPEDDILKEVQALIPAEINAP